jgi:hypothetical protein
MTSRRVKAAMLAFGLGSLLGAALAQHSMGKYRRNLFSDHPLRRLSALGYLNGHPSVEAVRLLRDYLAWEQHPILRRRAEALVRRMETKLG